MSSNEFELPPFLTISPQSSKVTSIYKPRIPLIYREFSTPLTESILTGTFDSWERERERLRKIKNAGKGFFDLADFRTNLPKFLIPENYDKF